MAKTNKQLQAEIDELIIERNNLIDRVDELEDENKELTKEIEELKEDIAELNHSNEYLATVQLDYEKEIKELKELVDEKTVEINRNNSWWRKSICWNQRIKIIELEKSVKWLDEMCEKRRSDYFKLEEKLDKCKKEKEDKILKIKNKWETYFVSETCYKETLDALQKELQSQIILKNTYKKENKRLKKRRREWRYNPKKVYEKLARWRLCYIPEWDYLPTKVHESLIDAMEEWHRLASKTWNQVYIVWTYCKI